MFAGMVGDRGAKRPRTPVGPSLLKKNGVPVVKRRNTEVCSFFFKYLFQDKTLISLRNTAILVNKLSK